jgi:hypothetical protein
MDYRRPTFPRSSTLFPLTDMNKHFLHSGPVPNGESILAKHGTLSKKLASNTGSTPVTVRPSPIERNGNESMPSFELGDEKITLHDKYKAGRIELSTAFSRPSSLRLTKLDTVLPDGDNGYLHHSPWP